jgi:hypothetical protein
MNLAVRTKTPWRSRVARFSVLVTIFTLAPPRVGQAQNFPSFYIRNYMGRCLDFGQAPQTAGAPVFIDNCGSIVEQQVGIEEFKPPVIGLAAKPSFTFPRRPTSHEVRLHAGSMCIASNAAAPEHGSPVVLAPCSLAASQIFVLDGDSIILEANRNLVIQLGNGDTRQKAPLLLGHRNLSDVEFWDFTATDNSNSWPTSVFVSVTDPAGLEQALSSAGPNTVIEITPDAGLIKFTALTTALQIKSGVTVRGNRRGVSLGPQLSLSVDSGVVPVTSTPYDGMTKFTGFLEAVGTNIRVTGLRIRGPSRDSDCSNHPDGSCSQHGVAGFIMKTANDATKVILDHNDISDWTKAALDLYSFHGEGRSCQQLSQAPRNLIVSRNFIHDNRQSQNNVKPISDADGYGLAAGWGISPLIDGNTFLENVHSITSDGTMYAGYVARNNLILSTNLGANIDMHGSGTDHDGGVAGSGVEVLHNSFLDGQNQNFSVRGFPCSGALDVFRDNVVFQNEESAINWEIGGTQPPYLVIDSKFFPTTSNQGSAPPTSNQGFAPPTFSLANPTQLFGVGDFDGDDKDDLFLATGAGWYYAPAGNAEWRFLSAKTETVNNLLFGDFDGDGRTDVVTQMGDKWMVSWGGRSPWQVLSDRSSDWNPPGTGDGSHSIMDFVVGDFVGDNRADIFYADGTNWYVSDGAVGPFVRYATSSFRIGDLLFGHFDKAHLNDPKTDIVGVENNQWSIVFAHGPHSWQPLRAKLTNTMSGLIAADLDGDGLDDIVMLSGGIWQMSKDGVSGWTPLRAEDSYAAVGRFDTSRPRGADILTWGSNSDNSLYIISAGIAVPKQQSRQDMR